MSNSEYKGTKPWDTAIPETIPDVISLLERRIEVHQAWLDWFESAPFEETQAASKEGVGSASSQRAFIAQYKAAIQVLSGNQ